MWEVGSERPIYLATCKNQEHEDITIDLEAQYVIHKMCLKVCKIFQIINIYCLGSHINLFGLKIGTYEFALYIALKCLDVSHVCPLSPCEQLSAVVHIMPSLQVKPLEQLGCILKHSC